VVVAQVPMQAHLSGWDKDVATIGGIMTYKDAIEELLTNAAVLFEVVAEGMDYSQHYIKIISTRECIPDDMRDLILENWKDALYDIRSAFFQTDLIEPIRAEGKKITGLAICQYDSGFDAHSRSVDYNRPTKSESHYRYSGYEWNGMRVLGTL
jgi:hypothetical protein